MICLSKPADRGGRNLLFKMAFVDSRQLSAGRQLSCDSWVGHWPGWPGLLLQLRPAPPHGGCCSRAYAAAARTATMLHLPHRPQLSPQHLLQQHTPPIQADQPPPRSRHAGWSCAGLLLTCIFIIAQLPDSNYDGSGGAIQQRGLAFGNLPVPQSLCSRRLAIPEKNGETGELATKPSVGVFSPPFLVEITRLVRTTSHPLRPLGS